jgi:glutamate dehydrogenase
VNAYLTFDQVLQAKALRQSIHALDQILTVDTQYLLLLQIEKTLADCCDWVVLQGITIRPDNETITSYRHYLADYESCINQQPVSAVPELLDKADIPAELSKKLAIICYLRHFPFVVLLAMETRQDLPAILKLINDIKQTLGLQQIERQLQEIPRRDYWVATVCNALQTDIQEFTAQLVKQILQQRHDSCAQYLVGLEKQNKIKRYRRIYQENQKTAPVNLLAYVTLIRALENILEN